MYLLQCAEKMIDLRPCTDRDQLRFVCDIEGMLFLFGCGQFFAS